MFYIAGIVVLRVYFSTANLCFFRMKKVLGLGNALTDILMQVSDADIKALGVSKGSMNHITLEQSFDIQHHFSSTRKSMIAGGSASNTINAIASLGGQAAFIGKLGHDEIGEFFRQDTLRNGVRPLFLNSELPSGHCTVLITPDGERTFCTYLGASGDIREENITPDMFLGFDIFHIEGYLVQNHALIEKAVRQAKEMGLQVSFDMSSFNVINENKEFIDSLVRQYVDIVFANEDEALAYTNLAPEPALDMLADICDTAVVKIGKRGSLVRHGAEKYLVPAICTNCVDSTGAGDYYAAGFLFGLACNLDLHSCAEIGTLTAGRVCEVVGAKLSDDTWTEVRGLVALIQSEERW